MNALSMISQTGSTAKRPNSSDETLKWAGVATEKTRVEGLDRQAAISLIYDMYTESIYKFVYYKVGNREDAEDITSQVFIKAAHSLDVTQSEVSKLAWLYRVARTTITDHWRAVYKGPAVSLEEIEEAAPLHLRATPIFAGKMEDIETSGSTGKVTEIMGRLPENYRQILQLRFLEGCSLRETAQAMGITEGNAKVMQHRALQKAVRVGSALM